MVGMALMADGLHFHVERGFIYAAMVFAGGVEALNLYRSRKLRRHPSGLRRGLRPDLARSMCGLPDLSVDKSGNCGCAGGIRRVSGRARRCGGRRWR